MAYSGHRASVFQTTKAAVEATAGTPPASGYKKLTALGFNFTIDPTIQSFRPAGQKYTTVTALNRESTSMSLDGLPTFTEIVYPLSSVLTAAAITAAGGTTGADSGARVMGADGNHWFFRPSATDADAPVSFTVYKGSIVGAERSSFVRVTEFGLTLNRNDTALSGSALGQAVVSSATDKAVHMPGNEVQQISVNATAGSYTLAWNAQTTAAIDYDATPAEVLAALEALSNIPPGMLRVEQTVDNAPQRTYTVEFGGSLGESDVAAMTTTDSTTGVTITTVTAGVAIGEIELTPILPTQIDIYAFSTAPTNISDTVIETAANKLTDVMEAGWNIGSRYSPYYPLDSDQSSYAALIETPPTAQLRTRMQANSEGLGYLAQLRNGGTVFFRIKAVGATISSVEEYEFTLDFAGKVTAASELSDQDGVYAVEWTWDAVPELTNDTPFEIAVVNNLSSL